MNAKGMTINLKLCVSAYFCAGSIITNSSIVNTITNITCIKKQQQQKMCTISA